ncbi:Long-chain-alcohol oxidase FAO4B [Dendrobium catenatum]|uniref:Cholesterol oxidase n=1 Tax=Dendrobium catenatum TaxID=906689 RepID=A0A2I0VRU2_9ASPA|nr:Long-chain-alcohol oxidase FAO4B [Dendrobium catenatum]
MLGAQVIPAEFTNAQVMTQILEEEIEDYKPDPIKLSINFDRKEEEEEGHNLVGSKKLESCLACGNCLSGCPYNAKNSTDKNYLALAVEAGCVVKAEIKVQYIVKDPGEDCLYKGKCHHRRWRVYFNDLEYISSDFVVISAGVLGTTEILLKSQKRGLGLSDRLGLGISCNGNNVAYVTRSKTPLRAYGLNKKQFSEVAFHNRPGPAISASFTSSSGFTIQSGVLPTSYPYLFLKGIATYGWPTCYWFLHGLIDKLKCSIMGLEAIHDMILNVMGYDACDGRITFDDDAEKVRIIPPNDPLLPKKIIALQNITRKLGGILFMSCYRSTSVHLLGGCNAASNASLGVCNTNGQVFNQNANQVTVHEGLYVSDASLIPCSIGTNPCLTITTLSEHISQHLVDDVLNFKSTVREKECIEHADENVDSIPKTTKEHENMFSDMVLVKEKMRGFIAGMPCTAHLIMNMNCRDNKGFGPESSVIEDSSSLLKGKVGGYVIFKSVEKEKLFILDGKVDLCAVNSRTPYTQYMHYGLTLASSSGSKYILEGKKVMNPFLLASHAWQESTTMHVTFRKIENNDGKAHIQHNNSGDELLSLQGELRISIFQLLRSVVGLKGKHRSKFICLLLQSLWRTYFLQVPRYIKEEFNSPEVEQVPYPPYILHSLNTGKLTTVKMDQSTFMYYLVN